MSEREQRRDTHAKAAVVFTFWMVAYTGLCVVVTFSLIESYFWPVAAFGLAVVGFHPVAHLQSRVNPYE